MLYNTHVGSNKLIGSQRNNAEWKLLRKKPVESAVKGVQKSFQLCLVTPLFYMTNSKRTKDTDYFF